MNWQLNKSSPRQYDARAIRLLQDDAVRNQHTASYLLHYYQSRTSEDEKRPVTTAKVIPQNDKSIFIQKPEAKKYHRLDPLNTDTKDAIEHMRALQIKTINHYNAVKYEIGKREKCIGDLRTKLELAKKFKSPDITEGQKKQSIRGLENKIEKMKMKLNTAMEINRKQKKTLQCIQQDLLRYPMHLQGTKKKVLSNIEAFKSASKMKDNAVLARKATEVERRSLEEAIGIDKRAREKNMNVLNNALKDVLLNKTKWEGSVKYYDTYPNANLEGLKSTNDFEKRDEEQELWDALENLRKIVDSGEVSELSSDFQEQQKKAKDLREQLQLQIRNSEELKNLLKDLEKKHDSLKHSKYQTLNSLQMMEQNQLDKLKEEKANLKKERQQLEKTGELRRTLQFSLDDIKAELQGKLNEKPVVTFDNYHLPYGQKQAMARTKSKESLFSEEEEDDEEDYDWENYVPTREDVKKLHNQITGVNSNQKKPIQRE